ncbi:HU family DNA-binding protein [Alloprevotella tannerae]|jgi:putative DNA-binding protein|uniref:HU family DNA-binding protein n=1 Tax=Alloprevotella tannerae TaxID=76122 RepID=UPI003C6ECB87
MSINFRFFRASGRAANGGSHYVRPVVNNVLTLHDLAARVESETSFSVSDVKGLVEAFQKYIAVELSLGHSVRIDGLGTFSSALSGKVERSKEGRLRLRRPRVRTVNFRPAVALMRRFGETTFRAEAGAPLTYVNPQRDELLEKLRDLGAQQTCFLASDVMRATGMSRDRTYARLRQFVDEGTLLNVGTRRRAVYRLP